MGDIKPLGPVGKLKKVASKPREKPAEADAMIEKLSSKSGGPDKKFWMDFENSVLSEIRRTVDEIDPIEWLLQISESETGFQKEEEQNVAPDEDLMKSLMGTLAEIDEATRRL